MKLKLRREFPVSTSKVGCAIISSMLSAAPNYYYCCYFTPMPILLLLLTTTTTPNYYCSTLLYSTPIPTPTSTPPILYCPTTTALYICSNDCVFYIMQCAKNPMAQFYVDSTFASNWGCAPDLAAASGSWRKHKDGGEGRRSTKTLDKQ
jgi:hypothetical protein